MIGMELCLLGYLGYASLEDLRTKMISLAPCLLTGAAALLLHMVMLFQLQEPEVGTLFVKGIVSLLPGGALLLFAKATEEAIGYGDGLSLLICGLCLGGQNACILLVIAMLLTCPYSMASIVLYGRKNGKREIPFLPFLLSAYVLMLGLSGQGLVWG